MTAATDVFSTSISLEFVSRICIQLHIVGKVVFIFKVYRRLYFINVTRFCVFNVYYSLLIVFILMTPISIVFYCEQWRTKDFRRGGTLVNAVLFSGMGSEAGRVRSTAPVSKSGLVTF